MKRLVLGLGNPILGDDGVGWRIAEEVERRLAGAPGVEVACASVGGLAAMERLVGYDRAIVADAIRTGARPAGSLMSFSLEALPDTAAGHTGSPHDTTFRTAVELGRAMGARLPTTIEIVGVETHETYLFSETLSAEVAAAVPRAADRILERLGVLGQDPGPAMN